MPGPFGGRASSRAEPSRVVASTVAGRTIGPSGILGESWDGAEGWSPWGAAVESWLEAGAAPSWMPPDLLWGGEHELKNVKEKKVNNPGKTRRMVTSFGVGREVFSYLEAMIIPSERCKNLLLVQKA